MNFLFRYRNLSFSERRSLSKKVLGWSSGAQQQQELFDALLEGIVFPAGAESAYVQIPEPHYLSHVYVRNAEAICKNDGVKLPVHFASFREFVEEQFHPLSHRRDGIAAASSSRRWVITRFLLGVFFCYHVCRWWNDNDSSSEYYWEYAYDNGDGDEDGDDDDDNDGEIQHPWLCCVFTGCRRRRFYKSDYYIDVSFDTLCTIIAGVLVRVNATSAASSPLPAQQQTTVIRDVTESVKRVAELKHTGTQPSAAIIVIEPEGETYA